jgi:very-short-patch-repair endonuclease
MSTHKRTARHNTQPRMRMLASKLRRGRSHPERVLWYALRKSQLGGLKFRRQAVIGSYVVDFLCPSHNLVVEVDGESHVGRDEADASRTKFLEREGFRVVRVTNDDVLRDLDAVALHILRAAGAPPTPQPPPSEGGGVSQPNPKLAPRRKGVE